MKKTETTGAMKISRLMSAGAELDALVAEKAMGGKWIRYIDAGYKDPDTSDGRVHAFLVVRKGDLDSFLGAERWKPNYVLDTGECPRDEFRWVPKYSTNIGEAWAVMEKFGFSIDTCAAGPDGKPAGYWVGFHGPKGGSLVGNVDNPTVTFGETAPLAICRAALKKMENDIEMGAK